MEEETSRTIKLLRWKHVSEYGIMNIELEARNTDFSPLVINSIYAL